MTVTSANVANAITKLVAVDALPAIVCEMVMGNLVTRDFDPQLAQIGDSVKVYGSELIQLQLNSLAEATFQIPDVTRVLAVPDLLQLYMRPAANAIAAKIDDDLLSLPFKEYHPVSGGLMQTVDTVDGMLFESGCGARDKFIVTDVNIYSEFRKMPIFSEYRSAGEAGLRYIVDGSIGRIRNFYVFRCVNANGEAVAFTKDAAIMAIRRLPQPLPGTGAIAEYAEFGNFGIRVVMSYQPNTLAQKFTISVLYGCDVAAPSHAVKVKVC